VLGLGLSPIIAAHRLYQGFHCLLNLACSIVCNYEKLKFFAILILQCYQYCLYVIVAVCRDERFGSYLLRNGYTLDVQLLQLH